MKTKINSVFAGEHMVALCIIFMGILLRVYTLSSQSIWYDEFLCVEHLDENTWSGYCEEFRVLDPYLPPLYHGILYWWTRLVGTNIMVMRVPSLFFGLLSLYLMWILGKSLMGSHYSLYSLALFAFSPQQIYHAQGIRCYSLVVLLGLMSAFTFLRMLRDNRWLWWLANAVFNVLLLWTHWVSILLIAAWGLGILLWLRYPKKIIVWGMLQVLMVCPLILFILNTIQIHVNGQGGSGKASFLQILVPVLAFPFLKDSLDVVSALPSNFAVKMGYATSFEYYSKFIVSGASLVLALLFLTVVVASSFFGIRKAFRGNRDLDDGSGEAPMRVQGDDSNAISLIDSLPYLLLWFLVPSLLLLVPAYMIDPVAVLPRYTVFVAPSLYLLTALHLKRMRPGRRTFCLGLCILLCMISLGISTILFSVRGNYLGVGQTIRTNYDGRPIAAIGDMGNLEKIIACNADLPEDTIVRVTSVDEISAWLSEAAANDRKAWLIYEDMDSALEDESLLNSIEHLLTRENIHYSTHFFSGAEILVAFDITF